MKRYMYKVIFVVLFNKRLVKSRSFISRDFIELFLFIMERYLIERKGKGNIVIYYYYIVMFGLYR